MKKWLIRISRKISIKKMKIKKKAKLDFEKILKKDIKLSVGNYFISQTGKSMLIRDINISNKEKYLYLTLHMCEPLMNNSNSIEWLDKINKNLDINDSNLTIMLYKKHFLKIEEMIVNAFFYIEDMDVFVHLVETIDVENSIYIHMEYTLKIPKEKRLLETMKKVKISIKKLKNCYLQE